jgi:hypothetical protein
MTQVVNKLTGEVYELDDHTAVAIRDSWLLLTETIKACERAKEKLKPKIDNIMAELSVLPIGDYQFRRTITERKTYDKAVMRQVLDADVFDLLLVPDKTRIDEYLKDNLETLDQGVGTALRNSMVPVMTRDKKTGEYKPMLPYTTLRLEKL